MKSIVCPLMMMIQCSMEMMMCSNWMMVVVVQLCSSSFLCFLDLDDPSNKIEVWVYTQKDCFFDLRWMYMQGLFWEVTFKGCMYVCIYRCIYSERKWWFSLVQMLDGGCL